MIPLVQQRFGQRDTLDGVLSDLGIGGIQEEQVPQFQRGPGGTAVRAREEQLGAHPIAQLETPGVLQPDPPAVDETRSGILRQVGSGFIEPLTKGLDKMGIIDERTEPAEPQTIGEHVARTVGNVAGYAIPAGLLLAPGVGWGIKAAGAGALTKAGVGAGAGSAMMGVGKGATAAKKLTMAGRAVQSGITSAGTGAYHGWVEDMEPEEIIREAVISGTIGTAAIPAIDRIGRSLPYRELKGTMSETLRRIRHGPHPRPSPHQIGEMYRTGPERVLRETATDIRDRLKRRAGQDLDSYLASNDEGARLVQMARNRGVSVAELPESEKIASLAETLPQDQFDSIFRPAFRAWNRVQDHLPVNLRDGTIHSAKYSETLDRMGGYAGANIRDDAIQKAKYTRPPKNLDNYSLKEQIRWVENRMTRARQAERQIYAEHGTEDWKTIRKASKRDYDKLVEWQERIEGFDEIRATKLAPLADDALGKAPSDQIASAWLSRLSQEELRRKSFSTRYELNPALKSVLTQEGVQDYRYLSMAGKRQYSQIRQGLREQGIPSKEAIYELRPEDIMSREAAEEFRDRIMRAPAPKQPSSLDDAILRQPRSLFDFFNPERKVYGEFVTREFRVANHAYQHEASLWTDRWRKVLEDADLVHKPMQAKRITDSKNAAREDIFNFLAGELDEATLTSRHGTKVKNSARKTRQLLDEVADSVGIPKDQRWENYAPRIMQEMKRNKSPERVANEVFGLDEPIGWEYFARQMRDGYLHPQERDIGKVVEAYIRGGMKDKHIKPVADSIDSMMARVNAHPSKKQGWEKIKRKMYGMPTDIEKMTDEMIHNVGHTLFGVDTQKRYTQEISRFITDLYYSSGLGYNFFTPLKNLTQQVLSVTNFDDPLEGVEYWFRAKKALGTKLGRETEQMWNFAKMGRVPNEYLHMENSILGRIPGKAGKFGDKIHRGAFHLYRKSDLNNLETSWMMKFLHSMDQGQSFQQAAEEAYSHTLATQFAYGIDSPGLFKEPIGRAMGVFASWPLNYLSLVKEQAARGSWHRAAVGAGALAYGAEALSQTGIDFSSIHPVETAKGILPVAMFHDDQHRRPLPIQGTQAVGNYIASLASGDPEVRERASERALDAASDLFLYSTQGERLLDTYQAALNDFAIMDERERLQYKMAREGPIYEAVGIPGEFIRGMIGPTTEGRRRFEGMNRIRELENTYRHERAKAVDAFMAGDMETFTEKQQRLLMLWGQQIEPHDLEQELELREMDYLERRARGLPKEVRKSALNKIHPDQMENMLGFDPIEPYGLTAR